MNTTIPNTSRTAHLLALMKKGDDAFEDQNAVISKVVPKISEVPVANFFATEE